MYYIRNSRKSDRAGSDMSTYKQKATTVKAALPDGTCVVESQSNICLSELGNTLNTISQNGIAEVLETMASAKAGVLEPYLEIEVLNTLAIFLVKMIDSIKTLCSYARHLKLQFFSAII